MRLNLLPFSFLLLLLTAPVLAAQESDSSKVASIKQTRHLLITSMLANDPVECVVLMDSLYRLEDSTHAAIDWDERWLLYYWLGNYGNLLGEVADFDSIRTLQRQRKIAPPTDSLFATIDGLVYPLRFDLFQEIHRAFLTESEKAMATMTLEYLLQLDEQEENWGLKPANFRVVYPNSRFENFAVFLQEVTAYTLAPTSGFPTTYKRSGKPTWALQFDGALYGGYWRGELDRTLNSSYGLDLGATYWKNRHNIGWRISFGGQKLQRDLYEGNEVWPREAESNLTITGFEYGFDIVNNTRLKLMPAVGYNVSFLFPPVPDEDDTSAPIYSDDFRYSEFHPSFSLTLDLKNQKTGAEKIKTSHFHGFRLRGGLRWMNYGKDNESLDGYMFFFSLGYGIFTYQYPHG
ncbi:MAG: hypothetical protein IT270_11395 [Saprospiraceae bacterium]|nr:hypothetical protein [Saprospiraceae bacterium]